MIYILFILHITWVPTTLIFFFSSSNPRHFFCSGPLPKHLLSISCMHALLQCNRTKLLQLCLTRCHPMDCSLPGSSVYGILQVRKLEMIAVPCSRGSSQRRDGSCISYVSCVGRQVLYHQCHLGSRLPNTGQTNSNSSFELRLNTASSKLSSLLLTQISFRFP